MAYEAALTLLADPTHRAILDQLRNGPLGVAQIAAEMPVSRPAVSQHLKLLLDAQILTVTRRGTQNLYSLAPGGLDGLLAWLEGLQADTKASAVPVLPPVYSTTV